MTHVPEVVAEVLFQLRGIHICLRQKVAVTLDRRSVRFFSVFVIQLASRIFFSPFADGMDLVQGFYNPCVSLPKWCEHNLGYVATKGCEEIFGLLGLSTFSLLFF